MSLLLITLLLDEKLLASSLWDIHAALFLTFGVGTSSVCCVCS